MKKLFAMILAICLVFGLVACGGNGDTAPETTEAKLISGTYTLCMVVAGELVMDEAMMEESGMNEGIFITFNGDGTGTYAVELEEEVEMEYDEKNIIDPYGEEGAVIPYEVKDGELILDFGDEGLYYFKKAN
jgi:hypothetical protein